MISLVHPPSSSGERGYVLMIVMILLSVLTAAGVYGMRTAQSDIRQGAVQRRLELASNAAEVGAAARMAEVMAASEDAGAALGVHSSVEMAGWTDYTSAPVPTNIHQRARDDAEFLVAAEPLVAVEANPPSGVQIGTGGQLTLWRIDSFGISRNTQGTGQRVSVGMSVWSRGGMSYNSN